MKTLKQIYSFIGLKRKVTQDVECLDLQVDSRALKKGDILNVILVDPVDVPII